MSVAAEEPRDQVSKKKKNVEFEEYENKDDSDGNNHFATFPWLYGILRKCREALATKNTHTLDSLLYAIVKELSISIKDCYSRLNRAGKLRDIVCQLLVYINMLYRDLKAEYMDNNNTYLHLMTELLAIYLDLEIKASKRGVHSLKKIGQFMTTALYTHLGESEDHIVEAILKAKLIKKTFGELCAPVLSKVLNEGRCFIGDENAFVRYLLAFKLLQKIGWMTSKYDITKMAVRKLNPAPQLVGIVRRMNIFPPQKIMNEPITAFLMRAKFDFVKVKREFFRTGSICRGSLSYIFPDKTFTYGNHSNSITNLLKQCRKDERKRNSSRDIWSKNRNSGNSADFDLDPSLYRISLHSNDRMLNRKEDDSDEIQFLGTKNGKDKPVIFITLDSDDETDEKDGKTNKQPKQQNEKTPMTTGFLTAKDNLEADEKLEKEKEKESKNEKEKEKNEMIISGILNSESESYKELSTKVINVPESKENPDSGEKVENLSTKHAEGALPSGSQCKEREVIDSTNNFVHSKESIQFPMGKPYNVQSNASDISKSVITSGPLVHERVNVNDNAEKLSSKQSSNAEEINKPERLGIIQNYSPPRTSQQKGETPVANVILAGEPKMYTSCQPGVIQKTNDFKVQLGTVNTIESKQIQQCIFGETARPPTNQRSVPQNSAKESLHPAPKEGNSANNDKGKIGSKNFTLAAGNFNNLMGSAAKTVNFENVAKSYKIVKSNRLKTSEITVSAVENGKSENIRNGNRPSKFIKIDKSGFISNGLKVKERVKFVSKSLDFRTSKTDSDVSKRGREERESIKMIEGKSVGSRTRTSQCVPIIFKKIEDTKSQGAEKKRKSSQRGIGDKKTPRSNQIKRKLKSHNSNVIKTDINMKSTLKHINPSSIPQFAADTSNDRKRKYAMVEPSAPKIKCVSNYASADARVDEIKLLIPDKFLGLKNSDAFQNRGKESSSMPVIRPNPAHYLPNHESLPFPFGAPEISYNQFPSIHQIDQTPYCKKPDHTPKTQNGDVEQIQRYIVNENVAAPVAKFEPQRPNSIPFEEGYQDIFPLLNCDGIKNLEPENGKHDLSNEEEMTDLVERQEGLNLSDDRRCENHGRSSSLEVGMAFNGVRNTGKATSNNPRDPVISEISEEELKDMDEELRKFVEPWDGPEDCCPDDDEFLLSALPDPQKLFSQDDFLHLLDMTFPSFNLNLEGIQPDDFKGDMDVFDQKCLCDLREERDIDLLESTFNESFLQKTFPDCDVSPIGESHSNLYEPCKKSASLSSPESRSDDQPKTCFEKGRRSSSSSSRSSSSSGSCGVSGRKDKAGSSSRSKAKSNGRETIRSKIGVLVEGTNENVDKKKLRSDSVAYHTRSISQKGIPIEYALPPPKRVKTKRNRPS